MEVYINNDIIYVQESTPARVLELNTTTGVAEWHDGATVGQDSSNGDFYTPYPASQASIVMALGQAICHLNERMKKGF